MFNDKDIIRWNRIAKDVNYKQGPDLLQDFLLKVLTNGIDLNKITDSYVYTSLSNSLINTKRNKNKSKLNDYFVNIDDVNLEITEEEIDYVTIDKDIQDKLNIISESYSTLDEIEKKLFFIHFVSGMKQSDIAKETNLGTTTIYLRIKTIKEKIKELYDKNNKQ